jgi:[ribosomal protein S5]-alanine N-acetyltransferase
MLVRLYPMLPSDVGEKYLAWMRDPDVTRFLEAGLHRPTRESLLRFVKDCLDDDTNLLLKICVVGGELSRDATSAGVVGPPTHIGNLRIHQISQHHGTGEIGLLLGEASYRGKGLGVAALREAEVVCAKTLGIRKLTAGCYASNHASYRAFRAAGYRQIGVRIGQYRTSHGLDDQVLLERIFEEHHSPGLGHPVKQERTLFASQRTLGEEDQGEIPDTREK